METQRERERVCVCVCQSPLTKKIASCFSDKMCSVLDKKFIKMVIMINLTIICSLPRGWKELFIESPGKKCPKIPARSCLHIPDWKSGSSVHLFGGGVSATVDKLL